MVDERHLLGRGDPARRISGVEAEILIGLYATDIRLGQDTGNSQDPYPNRCHPDEVRISVVCLTFPGATKGRGSFPGSRRQ